MGNKTLWQRIIFFVLIILICVLTFVKGIGTHISPIALLMGFLFAIFLKNPYVHQAQKAVSSFA